uniref:protein-ribulosamine 3-kinase n=1 Tax=Wollemia nobilis TaxID=56998 RepID=A0A0C9RH04_9CONI
MALLLSFTRLDSSLSINKTHFSGSLGRHRHIHWRCQPTHSFRVRMMATSHEDPIREWILGEGGAKEIKRVSPVGGGCISVANRYDTDVGSFFVKTNRDIGPSMFEAEAIGLNAMYSTNTIRVPKPFKVGPLLGRGSYIIMEFIDFGSSRTDQAKLGRELAQMQKAGTSDKGFGFMVDNTIGSTPQVNSWTSDWVTFYSRHRLGYQLQLSQQQYRDNDIYEKGQRLLKHLPTLFKDIEIKPTLLHGDLWSGNICSDKNNEPVILDPACYYGHNEAEFGMSWCAGFGSSFYNSYFEVSFLIFSPQTICKQKRMLI